MHEHQSTIPLELLFSCERGQELPLSGELARLLGGLLLPLSTKNGYVLGNAVTTLDGVAALNVAGHMSGGAISGSNHADQALMGTLRAASDAVIIGAGTMRVEQGNLLTPAMAAPWLEEEYRELRDRLGKRGLPWNVLVTARGDLDLRFPAFQAGEVPVLVLTTERGLLRLRQQSWGSAVQVVAVQEEGTISAQKILAEVRRVCGGSLWLVEGGPRLFDAFLAEQCLNEFFVTLAPQLAGRTDASERPGLIDGTLFAPEETRWGQLVAVRRSESHLFLRYAFPTT